MRLFANRTARLVGVATIAVSALATVSGFTVVRAERVAPAGSVTYNCSSGTACVEGNAGGSKTWGVEGISSDDDGVHGLTHSTDGHSAVGGVATGTLYSANGVFGKSSNGAGVYGATSGTGDNGVEGHVLNNIAAPAVSGGGGTKGTGVYGLGFDGVFAESSDTAIYALLLKAGGMIFSGTGPSGAYCNIDESASLTCSGTITGGAPLRMRQRTSSGQRVLTYASESAVATIEDVGKARLLGGVANVPIDPAFTALMEGGWYYVFLTPRSDTRGLYVSVKTPTAFQVREVEHGRSSLEFDYRIDAHPRD